MGLDAVQLGATGSRVSEPCFGTWRFGLESNGATETDREQAHDLLDAYTDAGGNFVDTANVYDRPDRVAPGDEPSGRDRADRRCTLARTADGESGCGDRLTDLQAVRANREGR